MTKKMSNTGMPKKQGLYDPQLEKDSCGVGFVVNIKGQKSHQIVEDGIKILENLAHRGACGCDPKTGDGAGIIIQVPHEFFQKETKKINISLPAAGDYGAGLVFLPKEKSERLICMSLLEQVVKEEGQH